MRLFRKAKPAAAVQPAAEAPSEDGDGTDELLSVFHAVLRGTLPLNHACDRARDLGAAGTFSPSVLATASDAAFERVTVNPVEAWQLGRIVQAAARGAWRSVSPVSTPIDPADRRMAVALVAADTGLIAEAHAQLLQAGDIRLFTAAREAADEGLAIARMLGMPKTEGTILQRRGSMILDCYTTGRSVTNYHGQWTRWESRALDSGDPDLMRAVSIPVEGSQGSAAPLRWPEPLDGLALAEEDLRAAVPLVEDARRGAVLKALAQTLEWRGLLGGPNAGREELVEIGEAALAALDEGDVEARLFITRLLERSRDRDAQESGRPTPANPAAAAGSDAAALAERVESDWDRLVESPLTAWGAVEQAVGAVADEDPRRALRLLALRRQLPDQWALEEQRRVHFNTELLMVSRISTPPEWNRAWRSAVDFESVAEEVLTTAEALPPDAAVSALTLVMLASTKFDREEIGLRAHAVLTELVPDERTRHAEAYDQAVADLSIGEGVSQERAGDHTNAVRCFLVAADRFLSMGASDGLTGALRYAADLVGGGQAGELEEVSAWCASRALDVEILAPLSAGDALRHLIRLVVAHQVRHGTSLEEMQLLFQSAKGRRFAASLAEGTTGWTPSPEVRYLLGQESVLISEMPAGGPLLAAPPEDEAGLDAEDVVIAYSSEYETSPSDDVEGRLANVRRAIERQIAASITPSAQSAANPVPLDLVREALDARTALVMLYEGQWISGEIATYGVLVTRRTGHVSVSAEEFPFLPAPMGLETGGRKIYVSPRGMLMAALRRALQEEPAPRAVSPGGAQELAKLAGSDLRVVQDHLDELREQGVDHLLVLPHGAGHFAPFHLAGDVDQPLADHLTVTYLANLAQLVSPPAPPDLPRTRGAVFALSYGDQPRLPYLDSSESEGRAIAALLDTQPMLDAAATEPAFVDALESARWVHLRAHGKHDADAPMFQTVFLSPGGGHDGRLRAYEVLSLDLHGLELVTLGACQTALGRIDASDNLRGLPAALLLAGASAVIGTLWEVTAEASTVFFTTLYRCLVEDNADVIWAFGVAQRETRGHYPEYRDWGAFYLTGGCGVRTRS